MNNTELRLGNLVEHYGDIITVDGIDDIDVFNKDMGDIPLHSIHPITLTQDWLKRFGFVKINNKNNKWHDDKVVYGYEDFQLNQWSKTSYDVYFKNDDKINSVTYTSRPIKFIHQLQNLYFALTGEELISKLNK